MTTTTEEKRKRIAILPRGGVTMRLDYTYLTEEEFDKAIEAAAKQLGMDPDSVISYTLGTKDEMLEGNMYFCPRCGAYNQHGYEPSMRMLLKQRADGVMEKAGWYKSMILECFDCNEEALEIHTDKWAEESDRMNERLEEEEKEKEIVSAHPHSFIVNPAPCCGHKDSYMVSKKTKQYHCFACGKNGEHQTINNLEEK